MRIPTEPCQTFPSPPPPAQPPPAGPASCEKIPSCGILSVGGTGERRGERRERETLSEKCLWREIKIKTGELVWGQGRVKACCA